VGELESQLMAAEAAAHGTRAVAVVVQAPVEDTEACYLVQQVGQVADTVRMVTRSVVDNVQTAMIPMVHKAAVQPETMGGLAEMEMDCGTTVTDLECGRTETGTECGMAEVEEHCGSHSPALNAPHSPAKEDTAASACVTAAAWVLAQEGTRIAALAEDSTAVHSEAPSRSSYHTVAVVLMPEEQAACCHILVLASELDLAAQMRATAGTCCSAA